MEPIQLDDISSLKLGGTNGVSTDTVWLEVADGALQRVSQVFGSLFGDREAIIVADSNTFAAAGHTVTELMRLAKRPLLSPHLFAGNVLTAEWRFLRELELSLSRHQAIPIAVGSGTINDLTKLASHRTQRPYLSVCTAASMDGYSAYGSSITRDGSKQTFECPAPVGIIADLCVLREAPPKLNAAGYADLLAKVTAGADWILADALELEPIDPRAWNLVQPPLLAALSDPSGVQLGRESAVRDLTLGLMSGGLAMQAIRSSRPASGAEHQFSHLWDMQNHTHEGLTPSHGFKVGIGTLAVSELYLNLLELPLHHLDIDRCLQMWPDWDALELRLEQLFPLRELREKAREETHAKYVSRAELRHRLSALRAIWTTLRVKLQAQLLPIRELREKLSAVGAPWLPEQIGISQSRLRASYLQAYHIRRRFTVLDLAVETGCLEPALRSLFG